MGERPQNLVFGEVADLYDRYRPSFPAGAINDIVSVASLDERSRALEIGPGTGKATVLLAPTGCEIVAVEPSAEMAAFARRNCSAFPNVSVVETTYEDVEVDDHSFDLVYAAQSWHWVDQVVGLDKTARVLRRGAVLALFWNVSQPNEMEFHDEIDAVYARLAPDLTHESPKSGWQPSDDPSTPLEDHGAFIEIEQHDHRWAESYSTDDYANLMQTHSNHRMLDREALAHLVEEIRHVIDAHGGTIEVPYETLLFTARRA